MAVPWNTTECETASGTEGFRAEPRQEGSVSAEPQRGLRGRRRCLRPGAAARTRWPWPRPPVAGRGGRGSPRRASSGRQRFAPPQASLERGPGAAGLPPALPPVPRWPPAQVLQRQVQGAQEEVERRAGTLCESACQVAPAPAPEAAWRLGLPVRVRRRRRDPAEGPVASSRRPWLRSTETQCGWNSRPRSSGRFCGSRRPLWSGPRTRQQRFAPPRAPPNAWARSSWFAFSYVSSFARVSGAHAQTHKIKVSQRIGCGIVGRPSRVNLGPETSFWMQRIGRFFNARNFEPSNVYFGRL